jgi:mono/diheme cytochrome c family protein
MSLIGRLYLILLMGAFMASIGCTKSAEKAQPTLAEAGKVVYMSRCIACHNPDPHQAGSVGPDVYGSSRELIEARVLRAEYPAGYKPKSESHLMVAMPDLADKIDALYAFLNSK